MMKRIRLYALWAFVLMLGIPLAANATMNSANFSIQSSVFSGGGEPMSSANYMANSTLGQSSPLMDQFDPPWSTNFENYPGFWYAADVDVCVLEGDANGDEFVNMSDILFVRDRIGESGGPGDANGDGFVNMSDILFVRDRIGNSCL